MLLAVEGGGFFSSSASGYSKGLTLLLFGRRKEERPMRVSPWNQYQLVDQAVDSDLQLASKKKLAPRRWAFLLCFGSPAVCLDGPCRPGISGSVQQSKALAGIPSASDTGNIITDCNVDDERWASCRKSNLKKLSTNHTMICNEGDKGHDGQNNRSCCDGKRKVHWTDACGRELAEIKEFEVSDYGASDDDLENEGTRRCGCIIQ